MFLSSIRKAKSLILYSYHQFINGFAAILNEEDVAKVKSVWLETRTLSDEEMGPMPTRWRGTCQTYHKDGIEFNSKLLGVKFFNKGYLHYARQVACRINATYVITHMVMTGRDLDGHGSHTLATVGDIMVAFEVAISDGVDVLSISTGGSPNRYFDDPFAISPFHAVKNDIVEVAATGNLPTLGTITNVAPWMFTNGASTTNREFVSYITLGNN
ncbi:hypothetical protein Pint_05863 [Pistacia integerrima]|uniref:Uncharacterized protein n=1 Tax=Pistacia integerrima TaxID=434235 RepID=A0ACC0Z771_9ROSI|nr:hypothetical protein Pint_05863 [Pistacia integerrima]